MQLILLYCTMEKDGCTSLDKYHIEECILKLEYWTTMSINKVTSQHQGAYTILVVRNITSPYRISHIYSVRRKLLNHTTHQTNIFRTT